MFAVIRTGGKQYRVAPNDIIKVEKIAGEPGDIVELAEVILLGGEGGPKTGSPTIAGAMVAAEVISQGAEREDRRLQEEAARELPPQEGPSPAFDGAPHHRDPDRRQKAVEGRAETGKEGRAEAGGEEGREAPEAKQAAKKAEAKPAAKKPAAKAKAPAKKPAAKPKK